MWIPGPSPGTDERPEATILLQTTSSQTCPCHAPPPLCCRRVEGGRRARVTQITPHHTAYLHPTPNRTASSGGRQALSSRCRLSTRVTCSSGRSRDLAVPTNRVAQFVLGRAKGRGVEKNHFPLRFLICERRRRSSSSVSCCQKVKVTILIFSDQNVFICKQSKVSGLWTRRT